MSDRPAMLGNEAGAPSPAASDRARSLQRVGAECRLDLQSPDGSVLLMKIDYAPHDGGFDHSDLLGIYLGVEGTGRIVRRNPAQRLESAMYPGRIGFGVPGTAGVGSWDRLRLLVLGVDPRKLMLENGSMLHADDVVPVASRLHDDPLMAAVLTAMLRDADAHGLSSAFFDHGLMLLANRLVAIGPAAARPIRPLAGDRLDRAIDRIEAAISGDVGVADLAGAAGMSPHHFSRAFKAATGLAPYQYLTRRRIDRAQMLLREPGNTVLQVALMVGFTNPSQFASAFRNVTGSSPSAWRRLDNRRGPWR